MEKPTSDKHRNLSPNTTRKQIRWDNKLLSESQKAAKELNITWSSFVQESVKEKLEKIV